ncbi:hypothetical protein D3C71_411800 [compost metagenome]
MKTTYRIGFFLLFLGIAYYLLANCYALSVGWGECNNLLEFITPDEDHAYMNPLYSWCVFTPAIILLLSFFWKTPFKKFQRALLILFSGLSAYMGLFNFVIGANSHYNPTMHFLIIQIWNFASFFWILGLTIAPQTKLFNWPFTKFP